MLKKRVIPVLLHRGAQLVKGKGFKSWRSTGLALQAARLHDQRGCDELVVLNVDATPLQSEPDYLLVRQLAQDCFMPLTVGGGIKHIDQVTKLMRSGADKVVIGTAFNYNPRLVRDIANKFGSQAVTVAVDVGPDVLVWVNCGKTSTHRNPIEYAHAAVRAGAGEIIFNMIEYDGTMCGYNLPMLSLLAETVPVPVIACGGCSGYPDMAAAFVAGAHAVAAGALFQFTDATPRGAAEWLNKNGFATRIEGNENNRHNPSAA